MTKDLTSYVKYDIDNRLSLKIPDELSTNYNNFTHEKTTVNKTKQKITITLSYETLAQTANVSQEEN